MADMTQFPTEELQADLAETIEDIKVCQLALLHGVTEYSGGSVQKRLDTNVEIRGLIVTELRRREATG